MNNKIVVNTSPLIAFEKMRFLDLLFDLPYEFICPPQVESEILAGAVKGLSVNFPPEINVVPLKNSLSALTLANLDAGEAAVIELALQENISTVCIDEIKGRRAAIASGLNVVGSLGILGKAKNLKLISTVKPFIESAQNSGIYYDAKLVELFIKGLGE